MEIQTATVVISKWFYLEADTGINTMRPWPFAFQGFHAPFLDAIEEFYNNKPRQ
jgi:hypothetical protein